MMLSGRRPSGATIRVIKTFPTPEDCSLQALYMSRAPGDVALPVEVLNKNQILMPLAKSRVPTSALFDLLGTYQRLWRSENPRHTCSRMEYHDYVCIRHRAAQEFGVEKETIEGAMFAANEMFKDIRHVPVTQVAFVHGDAIVSNAVHTDDGVRLIDFSPRVSPSEIEVDYSKLVFSALGFDLGARRQTALWSVLKTIENQMDPLRFRYYLLTHLIRVFSKEPPRSIERVRFYNRVLHHALCVAH